MNENEATTEAQTQEYPAGLNDATLDQVDAAATAAAPGQEPQDSLDIDQADGASGEV